MAPPALHIAIGVASNTGDMWWEMGSESASLPCRRPVNLSVALESLTKTYGVFCLVAEARDQPGGVPAAREWIWVQVKGRRTPRQFFELLGGPGRTIATYASMELFTPPWRPGARSFVRCAGGFTAFQKLNPADHVSTIYLDAGGARRRAPADWTGVFVHTSK